MNYRKLMNHQKYILISLVGLLSACESETPSDGISVKDMSVEMHVTNNRNNIINVEVMLRSGPVATGESIVISGQDQLLVSTIGNDYADNFQADDFESLNLITTKVKMLQRGSGRNSTFFSSSSNWYYQQFDISESHEEFTLILERPTRKNTENSYLTLPNPFEIDSPIPNETFSRQGDIMIMWDNNQNDASMSILASLICVTGETEVWESGELFPDAGWHTITAATFLDYPGVCSLTLRVIRTNLGVLDPDFSLGGIILGHQIRSVVINTIP